MTTPATEAGTSAVDSATLAEAFRKTARAHPDLVAFRTLDGSVEITWSQARERVDAIAGGLAQLGVGHGDTVAILLSNRPEFHLVDLAAVTLGATPFSVYNTYSPEQIAYVVSDAGARVLVCEQALLSGVERARADLPGLEHVVVVDGEAPEGGSTLAELETADPGFDGDAAAERVKGDDLLTLIYTSGTTGPPKGVELSHHNVLAVCATIQELIDLPVGGRLISWLPAAHIAERTAHHYIPVVFAATVTACDNPREIISYLPQVRPTWFFAVPRIWEKLKSGLETMLAGQPEEQRRPLEQALADAMERVRLRERGEEVPAELEERVRAADEQYFSGLRRMLGLDEVITVNVGAAPTPVEVLEFFHAIGIELAELWGMSETCGAGTLNRPGHVRIGTVGTAVPGVELKLADDGELLVRGPVIMVGYRNKPEATAEAIRDGWLHTGDIAEIDADGYVRIVDRKKEIIINAAGKNMSPAHIEGALKSAGPMIGQVAVIGDRRPYNTALIVLDAEYAEQWASRNDVDADMASLARDERVREIVQREVDAANERLARVEQIKKFTILPADWEPGGDELTPTMKLKRKPIAEKYAAEIEAMYA